MQFLRNDPKTTSRLYRARKYEIIFLQFRWGNTREYNFPLYIEDNVFIQHGVFLTKPVDIIVLTTECPEMQQH